MPILSTKGAASASGFGGIGGGSGVSALPEGTQPYTTPGTYNFTVLDGMETLTFTATAGAGSKHGGNTQRGNYPTAQEAPGNGGRTIGTLQLGQFSAGDIVTVKVPGPAGQALYAGNKSGTTFGGGAAEVQLQGGLIMMAGGGGGSGLHGGDQFGPPYSMPHPNAGGGGGDGGRFGKGGRGGWYNSGPTTSGGANGQNGSNNSTPRGGNSDYNGGGGGGASNTAGGGPGNTCSYCGNSTLTWTQAGQGYSNSTSGGGFYNQNLSQTSRSTGSDTYGGSGGGGYYTGGGGCNGNGTGHAGGGGGGGGSSYNQGQLSNVSWQDGVNSSETGAVQITWNQGY